MRAIPLVAIAVIFGCSRTVDVDAVLTLTLESRQTSPFEKVIGVRPEIQEELNDHTLLVIRNVTENDISPLAICVYDPDTDEQANWKDSWVFANTGTSFPKIELTPDLTQYIEVDWQWKAGQIIRLGGQIIYKSEERPSLENNFESHDEIVYFSEQRELYSTTDGTLGIRKTDRKVDWEPNEWFPQ